MLPLPRRLRAALFLAGAFGALWGGFGLASANLAAVAAEAIRGTATSSGHVLGVAAGWAATGAVVGLAFAGLLTVLARGGSVERLTVARVTGWGAMAGAAVQLLWTAWDRLMGVALASTSALTVALVFAMVIGAWSGAVALWLALWAAQRRDNVAGRRVRAKPEHGLRAGDVPTPHRSPKVSARVI
jgi:hypothetical protein